jgi:hypothetical protein
MELGDPPRRVSTSKRVNLLRPANSRTSDGAWREPLLDGIALACTQWRTPFAEEPKMQSAISRATGETSDAA